MVVMDVSQEWDLSTKATAQELGVDECTLRYTSRPWETGIGDRGAAAGQGVFAAWWCD